MARSAAANPVGKQCGNIGNIWTNFSGQIYQVLLILNVVSFLMYRFISWFPFNHLAIKATQLHLQIYPSFHATREFVHVNCTSTTSNTMMIICKLQPLFVHDLVRSLRLATSFVDKHQFQARLSVSLVRQRLTHSIRSDLRDKNCWFIYILDIWFGVNTSSVIFSFLASLLWCSERKVKFSSQTFWRQIK